MDQWLLSAEKKFGPRWKAEISYVNRVNRDIVGLVDRNIAANYSKLTNVGVRDHVTNVAVYDEYGNPLILPVVWWSGSLSLTASRLEGTIGGLTGFGTTGSSFSAGFGVRPNEAINLERRLPNVPAFETKLWISGTLPFNFRGGAFGTYTLGEYIAPTFQFSPRFRLQAFYRTPLEDELFLGVLGQTILLEPRGARKYPGHANLDLRLERLFARSFSVTADLFNALGSDAIVERNLTVNDGVTNDPTSVFGARRRRVNPLALQVGLRVEF